jgi:hypothetical protein
MIVPSARKSVIAGILRVKPPWTSDPRSGAAFCAPSWCFAAIDSARISTSRSHEDNRPDAGEIAVKIVTWTENASLHELLRHAGEEDVFVLRDGHPLVLITPFDDDLAWYAREHDPAFLASLAEARRQIERRSTISHNDLKKEFGFD